MHLKARVPDKSAVKHQHVRLQRATAAARPSTAHGGRSSTSLGPRPPDPTRSSSRIPTRIASPRTASGPAGQARAPPPEGRRRRVWRRRRLRRRRGSDADAGVRGGPARPALPGPARRPATAHVPCRAAHVPRRTATPGGPRAGRPPPSTPPPPPHTGRPPPPARVYQSAPLV